MAFESLTDKLTNVFKKLKSKGLLTEADVSTQLYNSESDDLTDKVKETLGVK